MREAIKEAIANCLGRIFANASITSLALSGRLARSFVSGAAGCKYGITRSDRKRLVSAFRRINQEITSATQWPKYLVMAEAVLDIDPAAKGELVECGCFKGASTAALSLLCAITGRRLIVCDSFQGLPADVEGAQHVYPHLRVSTSYKQGAFMGSMEEVKSNIGKWGELSVCKFIPGFFSDSLPGFKRPLVFGFFDVDLRSSMEDCIYHLWPCLVDGAFVFTDDSCDMEIVKVWFDKDFWSCRLGCDPPGYIGSGCGIPSLSPNYTSLGYAIKGTATYEHVKFCHN